MVRLWSVQSLRWTRLTSDVNKTKFLRPRPKYQHQDQDRWLKDQDRNKKTKTKTTENKGTSLLNNWTPLSSDVPSTE